MDVIEGRGPSPFFVLLLVQRLPDDSMTAALRQGGRHFLGWGMDRHILTDVYDALNLNTRATGNWGKNKVPKIAAYPRPSAVRDSRRASVASIFARMQRGV